MRKNKRNNRHSRKIEKKAGGLFAGIFTGCILLLAAVNLLMPDKEMSAAEGRRLESRPEMSVDGLLSGDYMKKYEEYFSDQFVGRNLFRNIKVVLNRIGGSREENGVLIGKNGHLFETIAVPQQEKLQANLEAIEQFAKKNRDIDVNMILVPDAASVLGEDLPMFYSTADQERMIAQVRRELEGSVNWIDAGSVMHKHKEEALYYKTDKHWTSTGAYYVFEAAAGQLGIAENITGKFASYPVSASFNGELSSKSGCGTDTKEIIDIYMPIKGDSSLIVNYVDEQRKTTSLYNSEKLKSSNQYDVFLGGDSSVIDIKTVSKNTGRLLVIKDSFANSFIPFLTPYFREIVVVDPKYYGGTIEDIMDTYRITDALILYSGNTFFQDNNISGVLNSEQ